MEAIGAGTNCCSVTSFEFCTIRPMEAIGAEEELMQTQLGLAHRVFAVGDQQMLNAMATANKWITFIF